MAASTSEIPPPWVAAEDHRQTRRARIGSRCLLDAASPILTAATRLPDPLPHAAVRAWGRITTRFLRVEIAAKGLEHVDRGGSYLVLALHEGLADVLPLLRLPLRLRFAARGELFEWPHLGSFLTAGRHVRVDDVPSIASLRRLRTESAAVLDAGESLVIFPQGSILGVEIAFHPGMLRLARWLGRPVLPVVLSGGHRVWEHPYSPVVRFDQKMTMHVLEPIAAADFDAATARRLERRMKRLALQDLEAPARRYVPERDGWWDAYGYEIDPDFEDLAVRVAAHRRLLAS